MASGGELLTSYMAAEEEIIIQPAVIGWACAWFAEEEDLSELPVLGQTVGELAGCPFPCNARFR